MSSPVTRAEFDTLAARVAALDGRMSEGACEVSGADFAALFSRVSALEKPQDAKQPATTMPKCPECGQDMVPTTEEQAKTLWCEGPGWHHGVVVMCPCGPAYCTSCLPKHAPVEQPALSCSVCGVPCTDEYRIGDWLVCDEHSQADPWTVNAYCCGKAGRPLPVKREPKRHPSDPTVQQGEQPAQAVEAVTTALDKCRQYLVTGDEDIPPVTVGEAVGAWAWGSIVRAHEADQRAAVEAACKPLRAELEEAGHRIVGLEACLAESNRQHDANAQAARELARLREIHAQAIGAGSVGLSDQLADEWSKLLTKAGGKPASE